MSLKAAILELVQTRRNVSFVEVQSLPGADGEFSMSMSGNVVLWSGISEEAAQALDELRAEGEVHFAPTPSLTYLIDGAMVDLPLVKSAAAMARGYKAPHWLPVVIEPGRS